MKYDVIVVGASPSGVVLASRLSEDPRRSVLLLEAGPSLFDSEHGQENTSVVQNTRSSYSGTPEYWTGTGDRALFESKDSSYSLGRTSVSGRALAGQVFLRGMPADYDSWLGIGNDEWSFDSVTPYFRRAEDQIDLVDDQALGYLGRRLIHGETSRIPSSGPEMAINPQASDIGGALGTPGETAWTTASEFLRAATSVSYLSQVRHRLNLTVRYSAYVRRVLFDHQQACGVEVESGGDVFTVDGNQVVVCAGVVGSPQMLMLSGIGPASHLDELGLSIIRDLPGVGKNLRDYPLFAVDLQGLFETEPESYADLMNTLLGDPSSDSTEASGLIVIGSSFSAPMGSSYANPRIQLTCMQGEGAGTGEIRLISREPSDSPSISYVSPLKTFADSQMIDSVSRYLRSEKRETDLPFLRASGLSTEEETGEGVAETSWTLNVLSGQRFGSCRMGSIGDHQAVVDQYGRVQGVENLWIADLSILPGIVHAPRELISIVVGERIAEWMSGDFALDVPVLPGERTAGQTKVTVPAHSRELENSMQEINEAAERAEEEGWMPLSEESLARARQLLTKMYAIQPHPYWVYPCPEAELIIDGGLGNRRVIVTLSPDGNVIYTFHSEETGDISAVECTDSGLLPDDRMEAVLRSMGRGND